MKDFRFICTILACFLLAVGCADTLLPDDVEDTPETNYDVLWEDLDQFYALFELKGVDWDSIYTFRPFREEEGLDTITTEILFDQLCELIGNLDDSHVELSSPQEECRSRTVLPARGSDINFTVIRNTLGDPFSIAGDGRFWYGTLRRGDFRFGYIYIRDFSGEGAPVSGWVGDIDAVLEEIGSVDGIILDVRDNRGGNGFNAVDLAGRFVDAERPYLVTRTRNGPLHTDFTAPRTLTVEPRGDAAQTGNVVVLTNKGTFSAAEWFVLALKGQEGVTIVGQSTGGALSSRIFRSLPNGWTFSISIQQVTSLDGDFFENIGVSPDSSVFTTGAGGLGDFIYGAGLNILDAKATSR